MKPSSSPANSNQPAKLDPQTRLGLVHLTISDLERSVDFYQRSLGMKIHRRGDQQARLGAGAEDLLVLTADPKAVRMPRRSGLYHFALLLPSRPALARSLKNLIETGTPLQGFADHLVSEAIYLPDPDGNGIELYCDRPRDRWQSSNGQLAMDTLPLDTQDLLKELENDPTSWNGMDPGTVLGHMHLHVGDIQTAEVFYTQVLGFEVMMRMSSASFVSAGGYHHHIAFNIWNGAGAPPPPPGSIGLRYFTVHLQDESDKQRLIERLQTAGIDMKEVEGGFSVQDPSGNQLIFI